MKSKVLIVLCVALTTFLYSYNLQATQSFVGDTARDTLRMLEIWQNKEITLLGPPLSLGFSTAKEVYFSSVSLYFGLIGLIVSNFHPIGAIIPNILLFILSLPFLYKLLVSLSKDQTVAKIGLILYCLSPLIVNHARFFWNPNPLLPLSIFFWYFATKSHTKFIAGLILGFMFDFHYLGIIGGLLFGANLLLSKKIKQLFLYLMGFVLGSSPVILFELRNQGYLSQTIFWNVTHGAKTWDLAVKSNPIVDFATPWLSLLGFTHSEMDYPLLLSFSLPVPTLVSIALIIWQLIVGFKLWQNNRNYRQYLMYLIIPFALLALAGLSIHTRYLWGVYPLIIWLFAYSIRQINNYYFASALILFALCNSIVNITTPRLSGVTGINLNNLSEIGSIIARDNPQGRYNLSDSVTGDARATAMRYFVQLDAPNKPQPNTSYSNLDILYVLALDSQSIIDGARWEYTATPNLELMSEFPVGKYKLFKYIRAK